MTEAKSGYNGPTVAQARESFDGCCRDLDAASATTRRLKAELIDAETMERIAEQNKKSAKAGLDAAEQNARLIEMLLEVQAARAGIGQNLRQPAREAKIASDAKVLCGSIGAPGTHGRRSRGAH